jgi:hypothetical protein
MIYKLIILTKERGKIEVLDGDWKNISLNGLTLHSDTEPAVQEYYDNYVRCVWYYNGVHHSWTTPAIYNMYDDIDNVANQIFDIYRDYTIYSLTGIHIFTTVYYMIHGKSVSHNEWVNRRITEWRKEKIESLFL